MSAAGVVLLTGYVLSFSFIAYILFFERNESARRFSWLLAIAFIPVAGVAFYILFSGNFFTRTRRMTRATRRANEHFKALLDHQLRDLETLRVEGTHPGIEEYGALIHMNLVHGKSPILTGNGVDIITSGEETYERMFAEIENARESVNLSYFIVKNDATGKRFIDILSRRAREGVQVRLLYDHVGSILTSHRLFKPLRDAGGKVTKFFPVSLINPFSVNYRNHRKLTIIDGRIGWFGGVNIADEYANRSPKPRFFWRDTHVRMTGPAVSLLQKQFLVDWYTSTADDMDMEAPEAHALFFPPLPRRSELSPVVSGFRNPSAEIVRGLPARDAPPALDSARRSSNVPAQIVSAGPDDAKNDEIRDALIHMISRARQTVFIETPYFTPDQAFFSALKIAALSGTDVRVIIPGRWDKWYVRLAAMPYVEDLLACGVKFWTYPGFIHAKMFAVDGHVASIGSTNVDTRSFSLHFELNAFFYSPDVAGNCAEIFRKDLEASTPLTADFFARSHVMRRALWNFFRLFSPLM